MVTESKVDVFIPAYNRPDWTALAVESVLVQSFRNLSLTVSDDSTGDDVRSAVSQFLCDPRFSYVKHAPRNGMAGNWNDCIRRAHAEYVHVFHDDDILERDMLSRVIAVLDANPGVSFAHACGLMVDESNNIIASHKAKWPSLISGVHFSRKLLRDRGAGVICPTVVMRRSAIERSGMFCEETPYGWDHEMWIRLASVGDVAFVDEPLIRNRMRTSGRDAERGDWMIGATKMEIELARRSVTIFGDSILDRVATELAFLWKRNALPLRAIVYLSSRRQLDFANKARVEFSGSMSPPVQLAAKALLTFPDVVRNIASVTRPIRAALRK